MRVEAVEGLVELVGVATPRWTPPMSVLGNPGVEDLDRDRPGSSARARAPRRGRAGPSGRGGDSQGGERGSWPGARRAPRGAAAPAGDRCRDELGGVPARARGRPSSAGPRRRPRRGGTTGMPSRRTRPDRADLIRRAAGGQDRGHGPAAARRGQVEGVGLVQGVAAHQVDRRVGGDGGEDLREGLAWAPGVDRVGLVGQGRQQGRRARPGSPSLSRRRGRAAPRRSSSAAGPGRPGR